MGMATRRTARAHLLQATVVKHSCSWILHDVSATAVMRLPATVTIPSRDSAPGRGYFPN